MTRSLKDCLKHYMGTSRGRDRLEGAKCFKNLREKIGCGVLIQVDELDKLYDNYYSEPSIGFTIMDCFVFEILQDYRLNRAFFLQYNTPSSLLNNTMELKTYINKISPMIF